MNNKKKYNTYTFTNVSFKVVDDAEYVTNLMVEANEAISAQVSNMYSNGLKLGYTKDMVDTLLKQRDVFALNKYFESVINQIKKTVDKPTNIIEPSDKVKLSAETNPLTEIIGIVNVAVVSNEVNDVYKPMKDKDGALVLGRLDNTVFDFSAVKIKAKVELPDVLNKVKYKKYWQEPKEDQQRDPNLIIELNLPNRTIFLELSDPAVVYNQMKTELFKSYIIQIIEHFCTKQEFWILSISQLLETIDTVPEQLGGLIPEEHLPPVDKTITKAEAIYLLCYMNNIDRNEIKKYVDKEKYNEAIFHITVTALRNYAKKS
jgi:hypothetical protein